jgi:hypothetical protein
VESNGINLTRAFERYRDDNKTAIYATMKSA